MSSTNLNDARLECSNDINCDIFYDECNLGTKFTSCANGPKLSYSYCGSMTYSKGNPNLKFENFSFYRLKNVNNI